MLTLRGSTALHSYHYCKQRVHCSALQWGCVCVRACVCVRVCVCVCLPVLCKAITQYPQIPNMRHRVSHPADQTRLAGTPHDITHQTCCWRAANHTSAHASPPPCQTSAHAAPPPCQSSPGAGHMPLEKCRAPPNSAGAVQKPAQGEDKKFAGHGRHTSARASPRPCQTSTTLPDAGRRKPKLRRSLATSLLPTGAYPYGAPLPEREIKENCCQNIDGRTTRCAAWRARARANTHARTMQQCKGKRLSQQEFMRPPGV